ncbi:hypothetical protein NK6_1082 [Bradyrhizobium diazoefficiens]|uniref:Uncharacterized protein n=1 Tax=Bradyrhizobium diazoefficiens TaxID=1355477 RepID=A0A0E4BKU3_9BRAD|nr:hypothetical protein NK6_1082 [Bradyrhizobium diazoefficiens]
MFLALRLFCAAWGAPAFVVVLNSGRLRDEPSTKVTLAGTSPAATLAQTCLGC